MNRSGFVMPYVLGVVVLLTMIVTLLVSRSQIFLPSSKRAQESINSQMLALSGLEIGKALLAKAYTTAKKEEGSAAQPVNKPKQSHEAIHHFYQTILPLLNTWQTYEFEQARDGFQGTIKVCISCEEGKLDLNALWNFDKNQFACDAGPREIRSLYEQLFDRIGTLSKTSNLMPALQDFFTRRGYIANDPTELFILKEYRAFSSSIFFSPDEQPQGNGKLFLNDLFTVWTGKASLDPFLLSDSWRTVLEFKKHPAQEKIKEIVPKISSQTAVKTSWDTLFSPLYEKNFNSLPKSIDSILQTKFGPKVFSVLSYGIIGRNICALLAIIQVEQQQKEGNKEAPIEVKVRKVYWL